MEEMRSTDGQADATGLMRLEFQANGDEDFLDSVQPGNPLHARPSVFTSQLQTTQERLTIKFLQSMKLRALRRCVDSTNYDSAHQQRNHSFGGSKP